MTVAKLRTTSTHYFFHLVLMKFGLSTNIRRLLRMWPGLKSPSTRHRSPGPAVRRNGPDQFLVAEIFWNGDGENTPLPSREKMCGLTAIRSTRLNLIIRTGRNVQRLFLIPI